MATIQDVFSHIYTTEANLSSVAVKHGQIILCTDSEKLYIDHGSNRVSISDVVQVETQTALPLAPLDKFYITQDTGDVYFYINDEWKKLTDTIKDYTAFKVYAHSDVLPAGQMDDICGNVLRVEIPAGMTHSFIIRSQQNKEYQNTVVDWGDGTITNLLTDEVPMQNVGDRRYTLTHTYAEDGVYTVKVYGTTFFGIMHGQENNLLVEALTSYLPLASHHINLGSYLMWSRHLTWLSPGLHTFDNKINFSHMCESCYNLLTAYGLSDLPEGCAVNRILAFCYGLTDTDFVLPSYSSGLDQYEEAFYDCVALSKSIGALLPKTGFTAKAISVNNIFRNNPLLTWDDTAAAKLWNDPLITWSNTADAFTDCSDDLRSHVPTSWGGTSSTEIVGNLPVPKLSLNGTLPNTANGLVILNAQGKVDNTLLPDTSINLSNYSQNTSIKLTSTAGAVDLISNTMEVALYSGTAHIKANVDSVELQGTNLKFNNNAQNTAGGIVVIDKESGKIPNSVLPEATTVDLGNYNGNVSLTASGEDQSVSLKYDATSTSGAGYTSSLLLDNGKIDIDANAGNINMMAHTVMVGTLQRTLQTAMINASDLQINVTNLRFNSHSTNTANGLVVLGSDGKIPTNLYEQAEGGLTSVNTGSATNTGLTGDGTASSPISLDLSNYGTRNAISLTTFGGFTFKISAATAMSINTDANVHIATHTYLAENPGANVYFHGNATNTANGLVVLGADGKVPSSLLPEMSQSWTKVTINQSSFATSDDTYGGSYYELDGICSVEVYDADGYKVEFDVKCDFTGNKTRVYIPSGLAADTISNWTLLYLAKTIA